MAEYSCAPSMHDGAKVPADWFIREVEADDPERATFRGPPFAVCDAHIDRAMRTVLADVQNGKGMLLRVTKVTPPAPAPLEVVQ